MCKKLFLKSLSLTMLGLLCTVGIQAQKRITGVVKDDNGEPIIGASIIEKGWKDNGTITDLDGNFVLTVKGDNSVINISYVGFKSQEIRVSPTMSITMKEDSEMLDELVVVGYGAHRKSDLTGSISSVRKQDLQGRTVTNVSDALGGKVSGVELSSASAAPGSKSSVQIRGIGSNGSSAPLYVIDGRIASDASFLNPNDIENIEVLKDAASAAIYGAAAGNGVILISTKKGEGDGKITFDMQLASQSVKKPHVMNSEQWADYYINYGLINRSVLYTEWDGKTNTDWFDASLENSLLQKYNLSFQKGNSKSNIYLSLSYLGNDGVVKGKEDMHNAYSGVINASAKIKPWLEIGTNNVVEYNRLTGAAGSNIFRAALGEAPIYKPYISYDELPHDSKIYADNGWVAGDENGYYNFAVNINQQYSNPLTERVMKTLENRSFSFSGTSYINFQPAKWFTFTSRISYALSHLENHTGTHAYVTYINNGRPLAVSGTNGSNVYWQWENFGTFTHSFGDHNLSLMLGQSYSESRATTLNASAQGSISDSGWAYDDDRFLFFNYANSTVSKSINGNEPAYVKKIAYFGRFNYDYKHRYLFQASLRADAADLGILPKANRWGYFPAASAGWVVSEEPFMMSTRSWLDQFKLRVSWGKNGNLASLGNYTYARNVTNVGSYPFTSDIAYTQAYAPTVTGNKDLRWESSEQFDLGIDLAFFGHLTIGIDWYHKKTTDMIVDGVKKTLTAGFDPSPINVGAMTNQGLEVELSWQDKIGDFSYGIRGNFSTLSNRVTDIAKGMNRIVGYSSSGFSTLFEKDKPAWHFYGYKYLGVNAETGDPIFDTGNDDVLGPEDMQDLGSGLPSITYGVTINAAWKGLDLTVFGTGVAGNDVFCIYDQSEFATNRLAWYAEDVWSPTHTNGTKPRPGAMRTQLTASSFNVFDGSYFRIKQIQLGYTFPTNLISKIHLSNARIFCSLDDFFTITGYKGLDPAIVGTGTQLGVDSGMYPSTRKVMFGLNVSF